MNYVLDACAMIAYLHGEPGGSVVDGSEAQAGIRLCYKAYEKFIARSVADCWGQVPLPSWESRMSGEDQMSTKPPMRVTVPDTLRSALLDQIGAARVEAWGAEALVVEAARQHVISRRKAATILGYSAYDEREAFFDMHGLTLDYTPAMLEADWNTIKASKF